MSQRRNKFLVTQSLLSSWEWGLKLENGYDDFLKTLRREPIQQTKAMLDGIRFENVLNATLNGANIEPSHEWYSPIMELYGELLGAQQQVRLYRGIRVNGIDFLVNGVIDFLKAGIIYDTKFSKTYVNRGNANYYLDSPQWPFYFYLCPEAYKFQYKICDGKYIYTETYHPDEVEPIERTIKHFMDFLDNMNLVDLYCEKWVSKYGD